MVSTLLEILGGGRGRGGASGDCGGVSTLLEILGSFVVWYGDVYDELSFNPP